jgi:hypothetical protein
MSQFVRTEILKDEEKRSEREQSSISFPYVHFEDALTVARAMFDAGGIPCTRDQLSGLMAKSGNFVVKLSAARIFGLLDNSGGKYQLTQLAYNALDKDENRQREARAEAFLNVPLFKKVYEEFRGKILPPRPFGLEQVLVAFGVSPKQRSYARIALDKSARQTGYFQNENMDRLVAPLISPTTKVPETEMSDVIAEEQPRRSEGISSPRISSVEPNKPKSSLHPFVEGLLDELPTARSQWAHEDRVKWLQAAATIFELIYKPGETDTILQQVIVSIKAPKGSE